ncbi:MAG TPA: protein kinase [Candidatus Eisenbacteria bacterium]|jgi:Tol biopolymer transport system component/tRNA A-37 threonylcarbamoyl transferase component Bud32
MIGRSILHYQVYEKIGEGGMGVVYKARDAKLDRIVALKFLPAAVGGHETERARFVQEARAASAINHPNVCVIHDIAEDDEQLFIVMEHVEGATLRGRIEQGSLPLDEVVDFALQIGEALREAHQHGVVHRDIKSENIMVNARGQIKVMDFGLAKLKGSIKLTRTSSTVGTLAYMAPEQIEGGEVDLRADLFSFGAVLYEMLAGRTPFQRDSDAATMYAILNEAPEPVKKFRPDLSSEFLHVLNRALEKDREDRYQSAADMLIDLRRLKRESKRVVRPGPQAEVAAGAAGSAGDAAGTPAATSAAVPSSRVIGPRRLHWLVAAGALIAIAALALFALPKHKAAPATYRQLTFVGRARSPTISPDGQSIAYVEDVPDGDDKVMVQDASGGPPLEIFRFKNIGGGFDSNAFGPRWSPTASELMVFAFNDTTGGLYLVPRLGGPARPLGRGFLGAWSPDGSQLATCGQPWKHVGIGRPGGSVSESLVVSGRYTWLLDLDWSPRSDVVLCLTQDSSGYAIRAVRRTDRRQGLIYRDSVDISCPRWTPRGDAIYFLRSSHQTSDLMRLKVAGDGLTSKGPPGTVLAGLDLGYQFAVSKNGRRLVFARGEGGSNVWVATLGVGRGARAAETKQLTHGTSEIEGVHFSPDGSHIAFGMGSSDVKNIYTLDLAAGEQKRITFLDQPCHFPAWSPDGKRIAFVAGRMLGGRIWVVPSEGGTPRPLGRPVLGEETELEWAPGSKILYHLPGNRNFAILDPETEAERPLVPNDSVGWMFDPHYSPSGRSVAVDWNRKPAEGLWILSLTDSSQMRLLDGYGPIGWSPDGEWIYAINETGSSRLVRISLVGRRIEEVARLPFEISFLVGIDLSPDAKRIACVVPETKSDVWLVENFDPAVK